jgi:signal transduction histidine kinase
MTHDKGHVPLNPDGGCREISSLIESFNLMAETIEERDRRIREDQRDLEEANRSLDALNRSYMDMLSFVSHELKVPVGSVRNYLYLLAEGKLGPLSDKQLHAVNVIDRNNQRMAEMVRHYLNLARIENGELEPVRTRFTLLPEIIKPVLETLHADIENRSITVDLAVGADVALLADIAMVREVFDNLISNAVKYGRDGGRLSISCRTGPDFHEFSVGNEGAGIPADKLSLVFQKFARLDPGNGKARQKGTGLGLFITKFIIEAHGGQIQVESEPGQWTVFKFTLPSSPPVADA